MLLERLKAGLKRTRDLFLGRLRGTPEELETALLSADVGVKATEYLMDRLRQKSGDPAVILQEEVRALLNPLTAHRSPLTAEAGKPPADGRLPSAVSRDAPRGAEGTPKVLMIVGVNGSGKTTTVGKLAALYKRQGRKVLVAASDTYRDAAAPQLQIWADRAKVDIVYSERGQDAAAVAFDAINRARAQGIELVLIDTAGRLHTRKDLMAEASKIKRVVAKVCPGAPDEIWLVLDATVGQNGIVQARSFDAELGLTGLIVTKLDGTAKGGVLIPIALELGLPIRYIGVGEGLDDLDEFSADEFARAMFSD
jgi:fused signal recognition particle receptor